MSPLQERLMALIGEAEAKGKGMKLAQLEQLVLEYGEVLQQTLLQGLVTQREVQGADQGVKKLPRLPKNPEGLLPLWEEGHQPVGAGGGSTLPVSLRLWLGRWRVKVSKSQLQRLCVALEGTAQALGRECLAQQAHQALPGRAQEGGRRWCIEVDGSLVPTRVEGGVEWREVKSAVLYPMRAPSQRYYVSALVAAGEFAPLVHGLLRQAGVRQADRLIGISDGAVWIAELLGDLGVKRHILDVYHASTYFETLLQGLGFSEAQRAQQRRALLRGEIDLQRWLNNHLNDPALLAALPTEAQKALRFLEKQALLNHTNYPQFRREGLEVIASGQIEGANKHVIQGRLKIAGARWSVNGAHAKAFGRSQLFSLRPILPFNTVRHVAFPAI